MIAIMANREDPDFFGRHLVFEILEHLYLAEKAAVSSREKCHNQLEHPRDRFPELSLCHCFPVFHSECLYLTHVSLASFLWDKSKRRRLRSDATRRGVWSRSPLFAYRIFF